MRRRRLRAALLVVVAAGLAGLGYGVYRSVALRRARTLLELGTKVLPEVAQHIRNFRRVRIEDGRVAWEIMAEEARYFDKQEEVMVRAPQLTLHFDDGARRAHISGAEGRVSLAGRDLIAVALKGTVIVRLDDLEVRTDEATYERATDLVRAPGLVTIHGRTIDVTGLGLEVEVTPRQVRLLDDVRTVLRTDHAAS
jgi:LPS export ABC transporter protein LptC